MTRDYWTDFNGFVHKPTGRFSTEPEDAMSEKCPRCGETFDHMPVVACCVHDGRALGHLHPLDPMHPLYRKEDPMSQPTSEAHTAGLNAACQSFQTVTGEHVDEHVREAIEDAIRAYLAASPPSPNGAEQVAWTPEFDEMVAADPLLARAASIICDAACGMYSQCNSREAAVALRDAGLLSLPVAAHAPKPAIEAGATEPTMFWDDDNPEESFTCVEDLVDYIGEAALFLKVRTARSMPDTWVSAVNDDGGWIISYHDTKEAAQAATELTRALTQPTGTGETQ